MQSMFGDAALFVNISNLFNYVNLAIGFAILLYLRHFLSYQKIASRSGILTFVPILTPKQSYLFVTGFTLWTVVLFLETLRGTDYLVLPGAIRADVTFILQISRMILLTASAMYIAQALMFFAALPVQEGRTPPNLGRINWMRHGGVFLLIALWGGLIWLGPDRFHQQIHWMALQAGLVALQWAVILHTFLVTRFSIHPIKNTLFLTLAVWTINVPAEMSYLSTPNSDNDFLLSFLTLNTPAAAWQTAGITTITLMLFLSLLLRANFLYVQEAFRRASSMKLEKEVMVTFLKKIGERTTYESGEDEAADALSVVQGQDVQKLLSLTLEFGKEVGAARSGALYVRDDMKELLLGRASDHKKGKFLAAQAVFGPYPPHLDPGRLPDNPKLHLPMLHEMVNAEKISVGDHWIGEAAESGKSILIEDISEIEEFQQHDSPLVQVQSQLVIPMNVQNHTIAVLSLVNKESGESFSFEDEATLNALAEQAGAAIMNLVIHGHLRESERLEREMELASEVQKCLLPARCPDTQGYDLAAASVPAQEVGGDYFDFIQLNDEQLLIVVADVSDKGIPGALNMATVRSALRSLAPSMTDVRQLMVDLNRAIQPDLPRGNFVSMLAASLHIPTGRMEIARAGHEPLMVIRQDNGSIESFSPDGIALGLVNGSLFASNIHSGEATLGDGDVAVFYTDGITESMNQKWEELSLQRFQDFLVESRELDSDSIIEHIKSKINTFTGGTPQHDDLTIVVLKRTAMSQTASAESASSGASSPR